MGEFPVGHSGGDEWARVLAVPFVGRITPFELGLWLESWNVFNRHYVTKQYWEADTIDSSHHMLAGIRCANKGRGGSEKADNI